MSYARKHDEHKKYKKIRMVGSRSLSITDVASLSWNIQLPGVDLGNSSAAGTDAGMQCGTHNLHHFAVPPVFQALDECTEGKAHRGGAFT